MHNKMTKIQEQKWYKKDIILRHMTAEQFEEFNEDYQWAKMVNKGRIVIENTNELSPKQIAMLREMTKRKKNGKRA